VQRMAQVHITVSIGPDVQEIDVQASYGEPEQQIDVVFAV